MDIEIFRVRSEASYQVESDIFIGSIFGIVNHKDNIYTGYYIQFVSARSVEIRNQNTSNIQTLKENGDKFKKLGGN